MTDKSPSIMKFSSIKSNGVNDLPTWLPSSTAHFPDGSNTWGWIFFGLLRAVIFKSPHHGQTDFI